MSIIELCCMERHDNDEPTTSSIILSPRPPSTPCTYRQRVCHRRQERHDRALDVVQVGDWRHCGHRPDLVLVFGSLRTQDVKYGRAHRVSHVVQVRFTGLIQDVIDRVGQVDRAHLVPAIIYII